MRRGVFITIEGPEGCGKTTHAKLLSDHLRRLAYPCVQTREPGGTKLGEYIRKILLHSNGVDISDLAELFLFEAARAQVVKEIISPALAGKKIVVCDRFSDATLSYQGWGGGLPIRLIEALDRAARGALKPDLTILLDVDTMTGLRRANVKGIDRMERKDVAYHKRVRAGYLELAGRCPKRIKVVKVTGGIDGIQAIIRREADIVIQRYKRAE